MAPKAEALGSSPHQGACLGACVCRLVERLEERFKLVGGGVWG